MEIINIVKLTGIGIILGITTVIPGFSMGTMAVVFNVYSRLIEVITPNLKKLFASWKFLLPLLAGCFAGIFLFSKIIIILFENHPIPTNWFFIGLITGSIPLIYRGIRKPSSRLPYLSSVICAVLALALMVVMAVVKPVEETAVYTILTPQVFGLLAGGGAIAAIAIIIPGISGAFLLLVLGLYRTALQAVSDLNILILFPLMFGAVFGLLAGAAFIRFLLSKVPKETYGAILGLVVGSVVVLFQGFGTGSTIIFSTLCFLAGCIISFFWGKRE
ncbi:MAG: DUF368 domain-containing protein [Treponema sp.]|jgi:putative membrane protein|nr:DUF368 domain-containing protein [Treponema sp.]